MALQHKQHRSVTKKLICGHFPGGPGLAGTRMFPFRILLKQDDGGGSYNWSSKTCKAPVKLSPPTNQHPVLQAGCPSSRPTNSVKALKGKYVEDNK